MRTWAAIAALALTAVVGWRWHEHRVTAAVAACEREASLRGLGAAMWEAMLAEEQARVLACQSLWSDALIANRTLIDQQRARDDAHARERMAAEARWEARPESCDLALLEMERACEPALGAIQ